MGFVRVDCSPVPNLGLPDQENAPQGNAALLKFNPVAGPNEPDIEDALVVAGA